MITLVCILVATASAVVASEPFQIVRPSRKAHGERTGGVEVVPGGIARLRAIDRPVAVVGIVGPYHSGKSLLQNLLLRFWRASASGDTERVFAAAASDVQHFEVAEQVAPTTYGVWLLETGIVLPDGSEVLLMDSEGFYGNDVDERYDARIFSIVAMLSSHLVYTLRGLLDQQALDYLEILARRTQVFQVQNVVREAIVAGDAAPNATATADFVPGVVEQAPRHLQFRDLPALTVVVKDYTQDSGGLSPNDWLTQYIDGHRDKSAKTSAAPTARNAVVVHGNAAAASPPEAAAAAAQKKTGGGTRLREVFPLGITCHTMFFPSADREALKHLGRVDPNTALTDEFVDDLRALHATVTADLRGKRINNDGDVVDGGGAAALAEFIVRYINEDNYPEVPSLLNHWIGELTERAHVDIPRYYERRMGGALGALPPHNDSALDEHEAATRAQAIALYRSMLFDSEPIYAPGEPALLRLLSAKFVDVRARNTRRIERHVQDEVERACARTTANAAAIALPRDPRMLAQRRRAERVECAARFSALFARYARSPVYAEQRQRLVECTERAYTDVEARNADLIDAVHTSASAECAEAAAGAFTAALGNEPHTLAEVDSAREAADEACKRAARTHTTARIRQAIAEAPGGSDGDSGLPPNSVDGVMQWLAASKEHAAHTTGLDAIVRTAHAKARADNAARVARVCTGRAGELGKEAAAESARIDPFPDREEAIERHLVEIGKRAIGRYEAETAQYRAVEGAYGGGLRTLRASLAMSARDTMERNVEAVKAHSYTVFKCAREALAREHCTLCTVLPYAYDAMARRVATRCFELDAGAQRFSAALRAKAIERWVHHDMAEQRNAAVYNLLMAVSTLLVLVLTCCCCWCMPAARVAAAGGSGVRRERNGHQGGASATGPRRQAFMGAKQW